MANYLRYPLSLSRRLVSDPEFVQQTIKEIESEMDTYLESLPGYKDLLALEPFIDFNALTHAMAMDTPDLKLLSLLSAPCGVFYLERKLELQLTGNKYDFCHNYGITYYSRSFSFVGMPCYAAHSGSAIAPRSRPLSEKEIYKAVAYGDDEILHLESSREYALYILFAAIASGRLDLVKIFYPAAESQITDDDDLYRAIHHDRLEIYNYLTTLRQINHDYVDELENAADYGSINIYLHLLEIGDFGEPSDVTQRGCTFYAINSKRDKIVQHLESHGLIDPIHAIDAAARIGDLAMFNKYLSAAKAAQVNDEGRFRDTVDSIFRYTRNTQISQAAYRAGLRPHSIMDLEYTEGFDQKVFNLEHFNIWQLEPAANVLVEIDNLSYLINAHMGRFQDLTLLEMILTRYGPSQGLLDTIYPEYGLPLTDYQELVKEMVENLE